VKEWIEEALHLLETSLNPVPNELDNIDWKEELSPNNKKLCNHLSAFANYPGGGYLVFGIENKAGKVIGIDKDKNDIIVETLTNIAYENLEPPPKIEYSIQEFHSKSLLFVKISESSVKPVHIKSGSIEDAYIRFGGTTRKATRHQIGQLLLNSKTLRWEELHASKLLSVTEVLNSLSHKNVFDLLKRPALVEPKEILKWMEDERMVKKINGSGYYITNFGAISAATNLKSFDDLSRKTIRVIKYKGNNKVETEKEYPGQMGYAIGFEGLINFLTALLPSSEIIQKVFRNITSMYPEIALRELIANALIHQDFNVSGKGPMIEVFDNRIEISSPGKLLPTKKIDRLIGTSPESRNELLASAFRRYMICEERGSGLIKTITAIELWGLPPLLFEEGDNYFKVTMFAPRKFAEMTIQERIEACYQHAVLKFYSGSVMTNTSLRERFKMNEKQRSQISRLINAAVENGKIKPRNPENKSVKFTEYIPYWV